jgi:hypothetical protein
VITGKNVKRDSNNPIRVRLHQVQEDKLNEMIKNETYCRSRGIYSKSDVVKNNILKEYKYTILGTA